MLQLTQTCNVDYELARALLTQKNWNYANAFSELKERERRENLVIKFYSEHNSLDNMEQARSILMQYGWNYDYAH